jgi:acetyltransferase-like isoleucine patch superfamily enzyme
MKKSVLHRLFNRAMHALVRRLPGSTSLRPLLHRLRGVKIGRGVFIGDEVYLENEYPEAVEIQDGAQVSIRAILLAHTRGPGRVIIEKNAYIGPNAVVVASGGQTLRIGEGAVISAGVVVTSSVAPRMYVANTAAKVLAEAKIPLAQAQSVQEFTGGLVPIKR